MNIISISFIVYIILQMAKKRRKPMDKAKESWKKAIEWWKGFWKWARNTLEDTALAIWFALLSAWSKWDELISNKRKKREWITENQRKKHERKAKEHSEEAKAYIKKAWEEGKKIIPEARWAIKWGWKAVWYAIKWGVHLIDAWDKAIWAKIEKKQIEKWKKPWKITKFFRDNIMKLMLALSIAGASWYGAKKLVVDTQQDKKEITVAHSDDKEDWTKVIEFPEKRELSFEERSYFQNPNFFDKDFKVTRDETYKDKWVILIRDAWMTFYVVQEGETKKQDIREKLSSIPEFSYLKDSLYLDKIKGFNVPNSSLKKWLYIPIPVKVEDRRINLDEFREYSKISVQEMKADPVYWEKMKTLLDKIGEERVINTMAAYARCETAIDHEKFLDPIWTAELHRWEPTYSSFSFSYYHVLMEKNADGKTPWPWLRARQNLWLTEWQCYHPINAWKLFLWYCFEKNPDPTFFFIINNLSEAKVKWKAYNGESVYWVKLWANIQHIK